MSQPSIPSHVPEALVRDFNPFLFEGSSEDVHKAWRRIIDTEPDVFYTPQAGGLWVLTSAALIEEVWPDAEQFSSGQGGVGIPPTPPGFPPFLPIDSDDPFHRVLRRPLNLALTPKAVKGLADEARRLAAELISEIAPRGRCDFVDEFSLKMPMNLFLKMVDLPREDREYLISLTHDAIKNPDFGRRFEATQEMFGYVDKRVRERNEAPGNDLISTIIALDAGGRQLTHEEQVGYIAQVMFGGLDTVGGTMSMIAKHLAENPQNRAHVAANVSTDPFVIEELLRRFSIPSLARNLTSDIEFHGVTMKRGDRVMIPSMVHGLDGRRWENAMDVDFSRKPRGHMAFGTGTHVCPGANLARAEIKVFLEEWLSRIPDFVIDPASTPTYQAGSVAGLLSLPLIWDVN